MISAQFFTTINFSIFLDTLKFFTYKINQIRYGTEKDKLEQEFKQYLNAENSKIYSFYNARSALYYGLKSLNLSKGSEIVVSGYTCVSVINAILQAGFKPLYIDIDENLNLSLKDLKQKITKNTKAIIFQHTFGNPSGIYEIFNFAQSHNLFLIEDVAHALGSEIGGKKAGTFGDISIFSTGRDKVISSITGGFLLVNNPNINFQNPKLIMPSRKLTFQNLAYNILSYLAWKSYDIKIGKIIMYLANKLNLIPKILTTNEKACNFNTFYYDLPNSLAYLARRQLRQLDKINNHRIRLANIYKAGLKNKINFPKTEFGSKNIYFGFPIILKNKDGLEKIVKEAKKHNIYLGTYWTGQNIVPIGSNLDKCVYKKGTCPNAENISLKIVILPNHFQVKEKDIKKIINIINDTFD